MKQRVSECPIWHSMSTRDRRAPYAALFVVLALFSGALALLTISLGPAPVELDAAQYWTLASDVAAGDLLQRRQAVDYRTPLYPIFLGPYRLLFGDDALLAVVISQHILVILTNCFVAYLVWRMTKSKLAVLACYSLCAFSLMRPWFANLVCPETLFGFLLVATFGILCWYFQRPSLIKAAAFGISLGLTILVRPVPKLLWVPMVAVFFVQTTNWAAMKLPPRVVLGHAAACLVAIAVLMAPWYERNLSLFGEPFVARLPAVNKWQVCFQGGTAARLAIPDSPAGNRLRELLGTCNGDVCDRYCSRVAATLASKGLTNREIDQLISQACREAVLAQPVEFAWPAFKRFVNYWRTPADGIPFYHVSQNPSYAGQNIWRFDRIANWYEHVLRNSPAHWLRWNELWTLVFSVGTICMILRPSTRLVGLSLGLMFVYFAAVTSAVEVENYKYRVFLEPFMIFAAVRGCVAWCQGVIRFERSKSTAEEMVDTVPYGHPALRPEVEAAPMYSEQVGSSATKDEPPHEPDGQEVASPNEKQQDDLSSLSV